MVGVTEFFYKRTKAVVVIKFVKFKELIDTNGSNSTKSVVLFELRDTVFEAVFLNFLPEFNPGVVREFGGGLNGGGFFLGLGEDENEDGTEDGVDGVLFLGNADVGVGRVLDEFI